MGCGSEAQTGQLAWPCRAVSPRQFSIFLRVHIYIRMIALYLDHIMMNVLHEIHQVLPEGASRARRPSGWARRRAAGLNWPAALNVTSSTFRHSTCPDVLSPPAAAAAPGAASASQCSRPQQPSSSAVAAGRECIVHSRRPTAGDQLHHSNDLDLRRSHASCSAVHQPVRPWEFVCATGSSVTNFARGGAGCCELE